MANFASRLSDRLPALAAALWWGGLTVIGFIAVPLLFAHLPSPAVAGRMAARLFEAQTWVSVACTALLLVLAKRRHADAEEPWAAEVLVWVIAGMLLALVVQFGVSPRIVARQNLALWHSVGTLMYALQWLCALRVLWRTCAPAR